MNLRYLASCIIYRHGGSDSGSFNPFVPNAPFLYRLKISESQETLDFHRTDNGTSLLSWFSTRKDMPLLLPHGLCWYINVLHPWLLKKSFLGRLDICISLFKKSFVSLMLKLIKFSLILMKKVSILREVTSFLSSLFRELSPKEYQNINVTFSSDQATKNTLIKSLIFRNSRLYYYRKGLKTPKELLFKENLPVFRFQSLKPDDIKSWPLPIRKWKVRIVRETLQNKCQKLISKM